MTIVGERYELGPAIGSGGFGTVFRARDRRSGADVALKLVRPGLGSEEAARRLRREVGFLRRVTSRHVARVYDSGEDESGVWLVTELVEGAPLTVATLGRPLLPHEVLRVARGLLEGLAAVHAAGIVHGDVKPSNVLVLHGDHALDSAKIVDFGLARIGSRSEIAKSIGDPSPRQGTVLGTARYMAPEVLRGGEPTPSSDLYGAGLVLFELLDLGPLFEPNDAVAELRARIASDPQLGSRVPEPLSDVLARMLARDPAARYPDAVRAHAAVADLDTAPVSVVGNGSLPPSLAPSRAPSLAPSRAPSLAPSARRSIPPSPTRLSSPPALVRSVLPPARSTPPGSMRPPSLPRQRSQSTPPLSRLTSLPADAVLALRETLRHLDLPMLDALARRERGQAIGRIARAVALALRLELDAAALILEPLTMQSDIARAIGAAMLAPRARRATRARVDTDREDQWVETIDAELGAMLVALAVGMATDEDAVRDVGRCARALARLPLLSGVSTVDSARTTLRIAHAAARVRRGEIDRAAGLALVAPLTTTDTRPESPFHVVVRALSLGVFPREEPRPGMDLELAERTAAETGATLLDACSATALGALLAVVAPREERGLFALERAATLLSHGDAPSLEYEAELHRATMLLTFARWADAVHHLRAAHAAARSERAGDLEILSASLEVLASLADNDARSAYEAATILSDARLSRTKGHAGALGWIARALTSLAAADREGAEDALTEAEARVREASPVDIEAYVLVEVLGVLFDAARGALPDLAGAAADLERFAEERGFEGFHWFEMLASVVRRLPDEPAVRKMGDTLTRLSAVLGPESRLARERRTDAPPGAEP